ncbi:MAG: hypothetical protein P4L91_19110 [Burkholderiaceae bacterium]|nr:hypothetical protein [Burkholderiaceae bacterium]
MIKKQGLVDEISEKLCGEFQLVVPLHPNKPGRGKKLSDQEIKQNSEAGLQKFYQLAQEERLRHRLGLIARARVAFGLQQRLLQQGYAAPLVKEVLLSMLASVFVGKGQ